MRALLLTLALVSLAHAQASRTGLVVVASGGPITGTVTPLFASEGTGLDTAEARVEVPLKNRGGFTALQCQGSADPGAGKSLVITFRVGTCGSLADTTMACTLTGGSGRPTCTSANLAQLDPGQCWTLKEAPSGGTYSTPMETVCSFEKQQ